MQLRDGLRAGLPAAAAQMVDDVAALAVVDEIVEVDLEPEFAHPVVVRAPPRVGENGSVRYEFEGETAAGRTEGRDVVEQRVLGFVGQVDQQAFGAPRRGG